MRRVCGPISLSALYGPWGLLVEGGPSEPFVMMVYNPPYYARLFEACGYQKGKDAYALWGAVHQVPDGDERIAEVERQGIRLRTWSKAKAEEHVQALIDLRNQGNRPSISVEKRREYSMPATDHRFWIPNILRLPTPSL
jgi:hypothetical protein